MHLRKDDDELVVLDPGWFGGDVVGRLFSEDVITKLPYDGRVTADRIRTIIPSSPPRDMARLLTAMYLCARRHPGLDHDLVLPCLDRSDEPSLEIHRSLVNGVEQAPDKVNGHCGPVYHASSVCLSVCDTLVLC